MDWEQHLEAYRTVIIPKSTAWNVLELLNIATRPFYLDIST